MSTEQATTNPNEQILATCKVGWKAGYTRHYMENSGLTGSVLRGTDFVSAQLAPMEKQGFFGRLLGTSEGKFANPEDSFTVSLVKKLTPGSTEEGEYVIRVTHQVPEDEMKRYPIAAEIIDATLTTMTSAVVRNDTKRIGERTPAQHTAKDTCVEQAIAKGVGNETSMVQAFDEASKTLADPLNAERRAAEAAAVKRHLTFLG